MFAVSIALMGALAGFVPSVLLFRQNLLIEEQNRYLQDQNRQIRGQIQSQQNQANTVRRTELIKTLYDVTDCASIHCPPKADSRSRSEAARAFIELERNRGIDVVDLSRARLDDTHLLPADLRGAELTGVSFRNANLNLTDFTGSLLLSSDLRGAFLGGAKLSEGSCAGCCYDETTK